MTVFYLTTRPTSGPSYTIPVDAAGIIVPCGWCFRFAVSRGGGRERSLL